MEAFRIGITVALTNHVSSILGMIARDFAKTDAQADKLNKTMKTMSLLGASGALLGGAGILGLKAIGATVEPAKELVHQLELMKIAGMSQADIAKSTAAAWKTTGTLMTTTAAENVKAIGELRSVLGNTDEAINFLPKMQQLGAVMESLKGEKVEGLAYTTMQAVEQMGGTINTKTGQIDPEKASRFIDLMTQASIATHGIVDPHAWQEFAKKASGVVKNMDPSALILGMAPIIQEMGAAGAGTALTSISTQVHGGVMPQRQVEDWEKFGLIDKSKVSATKTGVRLGEGAIKNEAGFVANPLAWVENTLIPALEKKGLKPEQISDEIQRLFSRQTSVREASIMATQLVRIHKDVEMAQNAMGTTQAADDLIKNDPNLASRAAEAQWNNLKTVLGLEVIPLLLPALRWLAGALHSLTDWARDHPMMTKALVLTATALSALAVVLGAVAIAAAAIAGIAALGIPAITAGVVAAVAAIAVAAGVFWDDITNLGKRIKDWLGITGLQDKMPHSADPNNPLESLDLPGVGGTDQTADPARILGNAFNPLKDKDRMHLGHRGEPGYDRFGLPITPRPTQIAAAPPPNILAPNFNVTPPPPAGNQTTQISTTINLDGRQIANVVSDHQAKAGTGPAPGVTYGDPMATPQLLPAY